MRRIAATLAIVTLSATLLASAARANLLINGSFETGDITGWTLTGNLGPQSVIASAGLYAPEDGRYFLLFGQANTAGVLSQTFSDTPGDTLTVSGYLEGDGLAPSGFSVAIDGADGYAIAPVPSQSWTLFSFTVVATGSDTLSLSYFDTPSYDAVDNLSVVDTTPATVPEPATMALLGAGLCGVGMLRRRRA